MLKTICKLKKIDGIQRANARHVAPPSANQNLKSQIKKTLRSSSCLYFNKGSCTYSKTHDTKGTTYKHICSGCFAASGRTFPHPETEC